MDFIAAHGTRTLGPNANPIYITSLAAYQLRQLEFVGQFVEHSALGIEPGAMLSRLTHLTTSPIEGVSSSMVLQHRAMQVDSRQ